MSKKEFTVKQGLAVQAADLAFWQKLLKKRNYAKLQAAVDYENTHNEHRDGYDVMRGSDITSAVQSLGQSLQKDKAKLKTAAVNHYGRVLVWPAVCTGSWPVPLASNHYDGALPTLI